MLYQNIFIPWLVVNESFEVIKLYIVQRVALKFYSKVAIRRFDVKHVQTENLKLSSIFNEVFYLYSRFSYILSFLPWIGMQWRSKWYYYTRLDFVSGVCSIITTSRKRISPPAYNLYYWSEYFPPRGKNYKLRKSLWSYRFFSNYNILKLPTDIVHLQNIFHFSIMILHFISKNRITMRRIWLIIMIKNRRW